MSPRRPGATEYPRDSAPTDQRNEGGRERSRSLPPPCRAPHATPAEPSPSRPGAASRAEARGGPSRAPRGAAAKAAGRRAKRPERGAGLGVPSLGREARSGPGRGQEVAKRSARNRKERGAASEAPGAGREEPGGALRARFSRGGGLRRKYLVYFVRHLARTSIYCNILALGIFAA